MKIPSIHMLMIKIWFWRLGICKNVSSINEIPIPLLRCWLMMKTNHHQNLGWGLSMVYCPVSNSHHHKKKTNQHNFFFFIINTTTLTQQLTSYFKRFYSLLILTQPPCNELPLFRNNNMHASANQNALLLFWCVKLLKESIWLPCWIISIAP